MTHLIYFFYICTIIPKKVKENNKTAKSYNNILSTVVAKEYDT